mmetsp:Transcript_43261/g.134545  ORF Transcript_43261/g.134545 Transcript_43261/m.134545 type:complete len:276 (-) Transcript_43261:760-1587(-)
MHCGDLRHLRRVQGVVRDGPGAHGRYPRGRADRRRRPPEVAHLHERQRPLRGLRAGARAARRQGGLLLHWRPRLFQAREGLPGGQHDLPGPHRRPRQPHGLQPGGRARVPGRGGRQGGAQDGEPPLPGERAPGLPVLHGVAAEPAGPAPRPGGPAGLPARDRRRHRAHHLLRPGRHQRALNPHARPDQHPGDAGPQLGKPPQEEERGEEARHLPLPVPARQGQRGHGGLPRRLRQHLLDTPDHEEGGLHHRGPARQRRSPPEVHPGGPRGILQHG